MLFLCSPDSASVALAFVALPCLLIFDGAVVGTGSSSVLVDLRGLRLNNATLVKARFMGRGGFLALHCIKR